jgi:hypothetical protein
LPNRPAARQEVAGPKRARRAVVRIAMVTTEIETIVIAMTEKDILHATTARRLADVLMMDAHMMDHAPAIFPAVAHNQSAV